VDKISKLRFDLLLAQYLYKHKKLNLPGIGVFEADNTVYVPEENEKPSSFQGITFRNTSVYRPDDDLIEFIKEQTGKMKPLAISDLESYLTLGKQFLYIGKPFYLEGIGTLHLTKDGRIEFVPGEYVTTKLEDPNIERSENKKRSVHEEDRIRTESNSNTFRIILLGLVIVTGLGLVGWGGYYLYNKNYNQDSFGLFDSTSTPQAIPAATLSPDSLQSAMENLQDTAVAGYETRATSTATTAYRFVVEVTDNQLRAFNRFNDLRTYGNKIELDASDTNRYKLFYTIRATPADTLRIRDSLNRWYYRNNDVMRVRVEQ
jgi:hypothetical protein